nr:hypothetical protein [Mycoplasmopsis bovis]
MISSKTISILDEATSDIDTLTESKIIKSHFTSKQKQVHFLTNSYTDLAQ